MVKGIFTLVKYKAIRDEKGEWVPGDIVSVQEEQNNIQYKYHDKHMLNQGFITLTASTSASSRSAVARVSAVPLSNILNTTHVTGWVLGNQQATPTWSSSNLSADPPVFGFWTTQTRFSVPGSTRYIRSVSLGTRGSSTATWGALAVVTLTTPCLQEPDELLDVFYRVFVDVGPAIDGKVDAPVSMANTFGYQATIYPSASTVEPSSFTYYPTDLFCEGTKADSDGRFHTPSLYTGGSIRQSAYSSHINMLFGHRYSVGIPATSANVTNYHGLPFRALSVKRSTNNFITSQPVSKGSNSSVQNLFHRQVDTGNTRRPFLDIDNQGNSLAGVIVTDAGTWADAVNKEPFVHHYRVEITTGGLVGTAEYKIRRRRCTGWNYAQYLPTPMTINTMQAPAYGGYAGPPGSDGNRFGQFDRRVQQYLWPEFLTFSDVGITVMHVNGEFENITTDSTVPLPATSILQLAPAYSGGERTGDIFVACENTGLWKIVRPSQGPVTSITQVTPAGITNPDSCRGVTVNRTNGDVWAIFHDITDSIAYLGKSTDQGTTWTLYDETTDPQFLLTNYTSGSPGPVNILGLHINPYSVDDQLMIVAPDVIDSWTGNGQSFWWSAAGSSPTSNQVRINVPREQGGHLKYRDYFHNAATPMSDTQWFISGPATTGTPFFVNSSQQFGNARIAFGAAAANATNVSSGTGIVRNHLGIVGNLTYRDESTDTEYMVGYVGGTQRGDSYTEMAIPISIRTWDQFNAAGTTVYQNTAGVNTSLGHTVSLMGTNIIANNMITHIGNGIFLCANNGTQPYNFLTFYGDGTVPMENAIPWFEQWGWNGAAWERNNVNSKVVHGADADLLDTLQIRFSDKAVLIQGQDETFYDGSPVTEGTFAAGTGHVALDTITLSDGSVITVDAVGGGGEVTQFTVTTANDATTFSTGDTLTQASTSGVGVGFTLTPGTDNKTANPLVVGEYYDFYVYDGILLDDATAFAQTVYNYMHATDPGTDFTPGTVPAADVGARVAEPLSLSFPGWQSAENGLTTPPVWGEPGKIIPGRGLTDSIYMEQRLVGDFEFRFKMVQDTSVYIPRLGLVNWSSIEGTPRALTTTDAGHRFHIRYRRTGVNNATEDLEYTVEVYTGTLGGTLAATINKTDGAENDTFAFRRTGTTIQFLINGIVEYTFPTATGQDLGITMWNNMVNDNGNMGGWTLYDGEIDYTVNRRYVEVGNGVTTGAKDINFSRLILHRIQYLDLNILLDDVPAVILSDGVTPPAAGEVQILPCSGRLWFHPDDAGKTITGNWRILKKLNLE